MEATWTDEARMAWQGIPQEYQEKIIGNAWCSDCKQATTITCFIGEIVGQSLVLKGTCARCGGKVARVVEELTEKHGR